MTTLSCLLVYLFTKNFGIAGYALKARGIFAYAKMPNVLIAAYVHPGRCPGLGATIGLSARHNRHSPRRIRRAFLIR